MTRVEVAASRAAVRDALVRPEVWVSGWKHVRALELLELGGPRGEGRRYRTAVRAVVPYTLTWEMTLVAATDAHVVWDAEGDLEGRARISLEPSPGGPALAPSATAVEVRWMAAPTPRWMRWLWPLAHRLFVANHDAVMRRGTRRLAEYLEAP